ncbi:hypothetical protein [Parvularcula marina]|uniref:Lipoprotein n=1 Tax=Parvularcula marina TaxID=2292771 RepID=A0A371RGE2_9PROT|nr:hypothetical protein [Parvularcula marina]RFB04534.1 hypothetical protein DX908_04105 [Parvularcula marina]
MKPTKMAVLLSAATLLAACGGGDEAREAQIEKAAKRSGVDADVELDSSGEITKVEIKNGDQRVGQGLKLPSGFPDDVSIPDGWNVIHTTPAAQDGFMVQAMTGDSVENVLSSIRTNLQSAGWNEVAFAEPAPTMKQLGFEKDGRMTNVNLIIPGDGNVSVQLITMPKP